MTSDITLSIAQLIWIAGGVLSIGAVVKWIIIPFKKLGEHESRIKVLEDAEENRKATDRFTIKALNAIVNHMIDGNGIDKLKEVRDDYQNSIINHL